MFQSFQIVSDSGYLFNMIHARACEELTFYFIDSISIKVFNQKLHVYVDVV